MAQAETIGALLARAADVPSCGLRFVDRREQEHFASWSVLRDDAQAVAGGLQALGIVRGDRVAIVFTTGPAFFHAFFGVLEAGAVPVPLYPPVRLGRLDEYLRKTAAMVRAAGCRLVLAEPRIKRLLGAAIEAARPELGCRTLASIPEGSVRAVGVGPDDLGLVQFSSGTTVDPKPVALSHRALLAQVAALDGHWRDEHGQPTGVSWLPLYHDMGLIGCILPALELPSVMTLIPPEVFVVRPSIWLRMLSRYRATISVAPNFAFGLCVDKIRDRELDGVDLSSWRVALNGAEAVAPSVLRDFARRFAHWGFRPEALTPVYGLSEASLAVTFSDLHQPYRSQRLDRHALAGGQARTLTDEEVRAEPERSQEIVSVGRPLPGFALRIVDAEGNVVEEDGRVGTLWVRGPSLMTGYLGRPEATAKALVDGWLDTGDLGFLWDGELYLTGRAKDVVILNGRNHAPVDLEQAASSVEGARPGCAVAVSHATGAAATERLLLLVEHARAATADQLETLGARCREAVLRDTGLRPDDVVVLTPGSLPRTSSGKLRRSESLARHLAGTLDAPRKVTPLLIGGALARSALGYARSAVGARPEQDADS